MTSSRPHDPPSAKSKSNRGIRFDALGPAKMAVQAGKTVAEAVGVPGLPIALDVLNSILEKVEQARSNKEGIQALSTEIRETSARITDILKNVESTVTHYPIGTSVRAALRDPERKEYADLSKRIASFENRLRDVDEEAGALIGRPSWRRLFLASEDAATLANLQSKIAQAYQQFQFDGSIYLDQMLTKVVDQIIEAETSQVLNTLSPDTVNPGFRAAINSGKAQFLPGTRREIFALIDEWVNNSPGEHQDKHTLILEGGAGMGKSTIASEFCKRLQERGQLGASFFFTRGTTDLESASAVIPSVVKQLARASETSRPIVTEMAKKHLKDGGQQQQIQYAMAELLDPLRNIASPEPVYIVIDALDECRQDSQARELSELCRSLLSFVTESTSFRLFLTTRPLPGSPLRDAIRSFSDELYTISLYDDFAKASVDNDIAKLIRSLLDSDPAAAAWLTERPSGVVDALTKRANGLFVYARTAAVFLMENNYDFDAALQLLLPASTSSVRVQSAVPIQLEDLDGLYRTVLNTAFPAHQKLPTKDQVRMVLAGLLVMYDREPCYFDNLLLAGYLPGPGGAHSAPILERLRPVLTVSDEQDVPGPEYRVFTIMHDTFREFVTSDELRAGDDFHVSIAEAHTLVAIRCMQVLCAAVEPEGEGWAMDGWDRGRLWAAKYAYWKWREHASCSADGHVVSVERDALVKRVDSFLGTESQCDVFEEHWIERWETTFDNSP